MHKRMKTCIYGILFFFKLHAWRLYTWRSPDQINRNQIDYIICKTRWRSSVRRVTTLPGADRGTDHNLLIADVKIKLKRITRAKQTPTYDVENIGLEFAVEVKNRFNGTSTGRQRTGRTMERYP